MFIASRKIQRFSERTREKPKYRKEQRAERKGADKRLFILLRWNRDVGRTVVLWEVGKAREEDEKEWEAANQK